MKTESLLGRALRDPLNWIGGAIAAGGAFAIAGSIVAAVAAGLIYEILFLMVVPRTGWYAGRLSATDRAAALRQRREVEAALLPGLLDEDRERFGELTRIREEIASAPLAAGEWIGEIEARLADLQERFLQFARKRAEYRAILRDLADRLGAAPLDRFGQPLPPRGRERALATADLETLRAWVREGTDRRRAALIEERARESDPASLALVEKRQEMTKQLGASSEEIGQAARNVERQLDLLCDSFRLIRGQLRSRPPAQIVSEVEQTVRSSRALSNALAEIAPLEEQLQQLRTGGISG